MEFEKPFSQPTNYRARFIRIGEKLYTSKPITQGGGNFSDLVEEDGLVDEIARVGQQTPQELDAGFMRVYNSERYIELRMHSNDLRLPILRSERTARGKTGNLLKTMLPDFEVQAKLGI